MTKSFYLIAIFIVSNITSIAQQNIGIKNRLKEFSTFHNQVATHKKN